MTKQQMTKTRFAALLAEAHEAGLAAGAASVPQPMVVERHVSMLDPSSPVERRWLVPDGACGFAWITIRPAGSREGRLAKLEHGWSNAYGGGVQLWVREFGQSVARKEAYAEAYAAVLREAGVRATAGSRLD